MNAAAALTLHTGLGSYRAWRPPAVPDGERQAAAVRAEDDQARVPGDVSWRWSSRCMRASSCRSRRAVGERVGADLHWVEVVCSDASEHRRRVERRRPDSPGQGNPTWTQVQAREWEPFDEPQTLVDNLGTPAQPNRAGIRVVNHRLSPSLSGEVNPRSPNRIRERLHRELSAREFVSDDHGITHPRRRRAFNDLPGHRC
jgi:hypothetical protein